MTGFPWPLTLGKVQEVRAYPACVVSRSECFPKSFHQAINLHLPSEFCVQWTNFGFGVFINWARMKWTRQVHFSRVSQHRWAIFPSPQLSSQWLANSWKTWGYFLSIFESFVDTRLMLCEESNGGGRDEFWWWWGWWRWRMRRRRRRRSHGSLQTCLRLINFSSGIPVDRPPHQACYLRQGW